MVPPKTADRRLSRKSSSGAAAGPVTIGLVSSGRPRVAPVTGLPNVNRLLREIAGSPPAMPPKRAAVVGRAAAGRAAAAGGRTAGVAGRAVEIGRAPAPRRVRWA